MRSSRFCSRLCISPLENYHRLCSGKLRQGSIETRAIPCSLNVYSHDLGFVILNKVFQQLAFVDVTRVPVGDDLAEANASIDSRAGCIDRIAAALANEGHVPTFTGEIGGVREAYLWRIYSQAVGTYNPHSSGPCQAGYLHFQSFTLFGSAF